MKTLRLIGTTLLAITLFASCGGGGDDPVAPDKPVVPEKPDKPKEPSITVPSGEDDYFSKGMNFDTNAGEKDFTFQTDADWTISVASTRSGESWCSVSPTSGKAGKHTVKVKTEANTTYDNRQVTLTLAAGTTKKTIAITQKQQDALTLTKDKFEVDAKGGTIEVEVKANINYEAIISEDSKGWISKSTKSRGLTTSTLVFDIAESEESVKREGEIIIESGEITETIHVYQSGQKILLLSQNEFNVTAEGDTIKVELRSNIDFGVKMPQADWISEMKGSRATSSHTLYYIIKANETYDNRDAKIVFFDKDSEAKDTLHIVQYQRNALIINQKEFNVSDLGGEIKVKVSSNIDYDIKTDCDWINKIETRGLIDDKVMFSVKPNNTTDSRFAKIILTSKDKTLTDTLKVNQSAKSALTITKDNFYIKAEGETIEVKIFTNIELFVDIDKDWISQIDSTTTRALNKQSLYFKVNANESFYERTSQIELYNRDKGISEFITVRQSEKNILFFDRKKLNIESEGSHVDVKINSNIKYNVKSNQDWITKKETKSLVTEEITFIIAPNESPKDRFGEIIVESEDKRLSDTLYIKQFKHLKGTINIKGSSAELIVDKAGVVKDFINDKLKESLTSLKITGNLNGHDFRIIREMAGVNINGHRINTGNLIHLDISNANIVDGPNYGNGFGSTHDNIIGEAMFERTRLISIILPKNITRIEKWAFMETNLLSIDIPEHVISIGNSAFGGCPHLSSVNFPQGLQTIGAGAFGKTAITQLDLPQNVSIIEESSFAYCKELESINLDNNLKIINNNAFRGCTKLQEIYIPNSVDTIRGNVFAECKNLKKFSGKFATKDGKALIDEQKQCLISYANANGDEKYYIPENIHIIGDFAFDNCEALKSIELHSKVESIGTCAFRYCTNLSTIKLPEKLNDINEEAFSDCISLTTLTLPKELEIIKNSCFSNCLKLTSIILPEKLISIKDWSFNSCKSLKTITFPKSLKIIGPNAFRECYWLTKVICYSEEPPLIDKYTFYNLSPTIYVPSAYINDYKTNSFWKEFNIEAL